MNISFITSLPNNLYNNFKDSTFCKSAKIAAKTAMIASFYLSLSIALGALLHEKCHDKLHKKKLFHLLKKNRQFKPETFMSNIRWKLQVELKKLCSNISLSFGYITKIKRDILKLKKNYHTDAFVIANGSFEKRAQTSLFFAKRKNNRCLQLNRKGFKPSIRRQRYKIQPKDIVLVENKKYEVIGIFNKGSWLRVRDKTKTLNFQVSKVEKHIFSNGWQFIPSLKERVFLP